MVVVIMHACYFGDSTVANFNTVFIKIFLQKGGGVNENNLRKD